MFSLMYFVVMLNRHLSIVCTVATVFVQSDLRTPKHGNGRLHIRHNSL